MTPGGGGYLPIRCNTSGPLTPAAWTRTRISFSATSGTGRVSVTSISGPPGARTAIAVIVPIPPIVFPFPAPPLTIRAGSAILSEQEAAMALFDEDMPKRKNDLVVGEDLSKLSIDELEERIALLRGEIGRVEEALVAKRASIGHADSFFKV